MDIHAVLEATKKVRLQQLEDNAVLALLHSQNVDIKETKAYFYYQKYRKKHVFLYYLSKELNVPNGLALRKYVDEKLS